MVERPTHECRSCQVVFVVELAKNRLYELDWQYVEKNWHLGPQDDCGSSISRRMVFCGCSNFCSIIICSLLSMSARPLRPAERIGSGDTPNIVFQCASPTVRSEAFLPDHDGKCPECAYHLMV